ncbi:DUF3445 domain-containing protein [Shimia thalassica]|uniref:heme-dependent oxidative N-demethylase family protein n=1 Tax=Shimia thalassica TaxID=1715693 RepID=UPI0026E26D9E|nr:DUF3445 domain-containing protein [Shimia thalassica]MDO6521267.1 DUF3445 domain-containing protein [Shimia thalassica]
MTEILQRSIPYDAFEDKRLPGIAPLDMADWLIVDDAYAGQMARREDLLAQSRNSVLALDDSAFEAAQELLDLALSHLFLRDNNDFEREDDAVQCPDGRVVELDYSDPLGTLGRLTQEDFCLMGKRGEEHVLLGAVLCFPASWKLSEKFMQPLIGIHIPVEPYTEDIAKRVQRLFDGVRSDRPLWRFNALWYEDPELHQPRSAFEPRRVGAGSDEGPYFRSEKQSILKLPKSGMAVFSIHTFVVKREDMRAAQP